MEMDILFKVCTLILEPDPTSTIHLCEATIFGVITIDCIKSKKNLLEPKNCKFRNIIFR